MNRYQSVDPENINDAHGQRAESCDLNSLIRVPRGDTILIARDDGTQLRCISIGNGPTVVLAHGIFNDLRCFNLVTEKLIEKGCRVILFDQRGHGASTLGANGFDSRQMAVDCRAVLEHFAVAGGVLAGHSMGACLAVILAQQSPAVFSQHLQGLVLISGHAGSVAKGSVQNQLQIPLIKLGLLSGILSSKKLGRAFVRSLFGKVAPKEHVEAMRRIVADHDAREAVTLLNFQIKEDYYSGLSRIDVPTAVLSGERDKTCPRWHSERLGSEIPSADNIWLPDIGHMVVYEAPDVIVREIVGLFDRKLFSDKREQLL